MSESLPTVRVGPGFLSLLTLLFVYLKLTGTLDWSWWLVLAPTLIPLGLLAAIFLVLAVIAIIAICVN